MTISAAKLAIVERIKRMNPSVGEDSDVRVQSFPEQQAIASGERDILVVATNGMPDQDSEVVDPDGADLSYFGPNRSVFFDHQYDDTNFIGKVRRGYPRRTPEGWLVRFAVRRNERGEQLLRDHSDFGVSVSVGFDVLDSGPPTAEEVEKFGGVPFRSIVRKWRWLELSVTWIPCNPSARAPHPEAFAEKSIVTPRATRTILTPFGCLIEPTDP